MKERYSIEMPVDFIERLIVIYNEQLDILGIISNSVYSLLKLCNEVFSSEQIKKIHSWDEFNVVEYNEKIGKSVFVKGSPRIRMKLIEFELDDELIAQIKNFFDKIRKKNLDVRLFYWKFAWHPALKGIEKERLNDHKKLLLSNRMMPYYTSGFVRVAVYYRILLIERAKRENKEAQLEEF